MRSPGVRIAVLGATGALGGEVLAALDASTLRIAELVPVATDRSLGQDIEFQGEIYAVEARPPRLRGLDLVFCCAPPEASLDLVRDALKAGVPCIDCSGALTASEEVPVRVAALPASAGDEGAPAIATPAGPELAWSLVLAPLHRAAGVRRVVGSVLEAASVAGRLGIEALSADSLALFNPQEQRDPTDASRPLAFDCHPSVGSVDEDGSTAHESRIAPVLRRLLGSEIAVAISAVQVPAFIGQASLLAVETQQPLDAKQAEDLLSRAPGVELWEQDPEGPSLRAVAGRDVVLVGRVRRDPSTPHGLLLWAVADALRLAAANAVELAAARLQLH
jgi:aspartate-semialdehyde dehydrogenase